MKILSIETSCDETAIALMDISGTLEKPDIKVLGNTLYSQAKLHEKYGGVYPTLAKREHTKNLPILLDQVLLQATSYKLQASDIDFIAITSGPGLEPALWTGITFAEELGKKWRKPIVPVNHMEGHVFSVLYKEQEKISNYSKKLELPGLALLVSGGHTELVLVKDFGEYEILGQTRDDAIGEAFDKVARMLELPYPGGPHISALAENARKIQRNSASSPRKSAGKLDEIKFPRPMIHSGDLDFSFSGLKTAVLYKLKSLEVGEVESLKGEIAREFEDAAVEVLVEKTREALNQNYSQILKNLRIKTLIVAGGVSANKHLRQEIEKMAQTLNLGTKFPSMELTGDNALMIGMAGFIKVSKDPSLLEKQVEIKADGNLSL